MSKDKFQFLYGLDVGSTTAKIAILDSELELIYDKRYRTFGRPVETVLHLLNELPTELQPQKGGSYFAITGTGGRLIQGIIGGVFVNEVVAHTEAALYFHPDCMTILDMGGQDTKLVILERIEGRTRIKDFQLNTLCAAGTGSFLDQQAARLGIDIKEFGILASKSKNPATIAGRCTVFAKSDMIHLSQNAASVTDIAAGLAFSLARNIKATLAKGKNLTHPFVFQGGVAENIGVRKAIRSVFEIPPDGLYVPIHFKTMGAIGAVIFAKKNSLQPLPFKGIDSLETHLRGNSPKTIRLKPLGSVSEGSIAQENHELPNNLHLKSHKIIIGVDVGSISTKVVALTHKGELISYYYGRTSGRPLDAIKAGLRTIKNTLGEEVEVVAVGTTGSGRYLAGDFIGADCITNEITAQARAAVHIDPEVDTIFEIGGQDSKYIRLERGTLVDFMMNRACAAGTGSFLEEQAGRLGLKIEEFGDLALEAKSPVEMGERCTVFIESDLIHYLQQGIGTSDLVAGLCYSIVHNYLNKVVENRSIGRRVLFQGATALNKGIVAAFEKVLERPVIVPRHCNVTGAIGAALIALERKSKGKSRFLGFNEIRRSYKVSSFECRSCPNRCSISRVKIEDRPPIFYGGRCERYEAVGSRKITNEKLPDLVTHRQELIFSYGMKLDEAQKTQFGPIGIPYALVCQDLLPFFSTLLKSLGYGPVPSGPTTKNITLKGAEASVTEPCFPVKTAFGHMVTLMDTGIKRIFVPSIVDLPGVGKNKIGQVCPYVQRFPYVSQAIIGENSEFSFIKEAFRLSGKGIKNPELVKRLSSIFGVSTRKIRSALSDAMEAQRDFEERFKNACMEALNHADSNTKKVLLVGRPYNALDPGLNLSIHKKLLTLGALPLPLDTLELEAFADKGKGTYWRYGQKILAGAKAISREPDLSAIYITNFGCGPDSFVLRFFKERLNGRPFLELEIDEHSQDAGILTRIEAFLDTIRPPKAIKYIGNVQTLGSKNIPGAKTTLGRVSDRTVYIPYMSNHSYALQAALLAFGRDAKVLPKTDEESARIGMKFALGKECYPAMLTCGDLIKMTMLPGFNPQKAAFFMPSGQGPCRLGQYSNFHRSILDELGLQDVAILGVNQDEEMYDEVANIGKGFDRLLWKGVVAIDLLESALRATRPYAKGPKEAETLFNRYLQRLVELIEKKKDIYPFLKEASKEFGKLKDASQKKRPVVGIVGEIYVRSNEFANADLVRNLESLGAEVLLPTVSEWILYTNFTAMRKVKRQENLRLFVKLYLKNLVQIIDLKRMERLFAGVLQKKEPLTGSLLNLARPFITDEFEGEAILSIGKAIHLVGKGVNGIVSVMPFTCMPGTIVCAMIHGLRQRLQNVPFLSVSCDYQKQTGRNLRLEAFMHQISWG